MSSGLKSRIFPLVLMAIRTGLSGEASDRGCNSAISALVSGARGPRGLSREESAGLSGGSLAEASSGRALSKSVIFVPKDFVPNDNSFCFSCIIQELLALFRANQPNVILRRKKMSVARIQPVASKNVRILSSCRFNLHLLSAGATYPKRV